MVFKAMDQRRSRKQRVDLQGPRVDSFLYDESGFQILAYLERTIMYGMPLTFFAPDVIFYYSEHLQRVISVTEIDSKLRLFWSHWHSVDDTPSEWRKIYELGLKGLPKLDEEWKEWVRARAIALKNVAEGAPRRLRSASVLPRSFFNQTKQPSKSPAGDHSGSQVQDSGNYSGSPSQRKRMRMSTPSVSHWIHFLMTDFLTGQLHTEFSKNPKFSYLRTIIVKTKAPSIHPTS